jgi:hypothetical protein
LGVSSGPGVEVSIRPDAFAVDWPCRTSVNVIVCGPAARADPQLVANIATTTTPTKRRVVMMISRARRKLSAVTRNFTRAV